MKKVIIVIVLLAIIIIAYDKFYNNENIIEEKENLDILEESQDEGYGIITSKKDIVLEKGSNTSFEILFTNPDALSIREYIICEDQSDIILVKYSDYKDKIITVEVDALKVGTTKIEICDFDYPNIKKIVNVKVVDTKTTENDITKEMAYEGVYNYCHSEYDWDISEDNPNIMYLEMGKDTNNELIKIKFYEINIQNPKNILMF